MFFKDVVIMYIVVQLRLMALIFVIFLSFLVINKDLFVPENQEIFHPSVFNQLLKLALEEFY